MKIQIDSSIFRSQKLCRGYDYYINPSSIEPVEFGTEKYPFKEVKSALVELMSLHSDHENTVTINVMEGTDSVFK